MALDEAHSQLPGVVLQIDADLAGRLVERREKIEGHDRSFPEPECYGIG
jgi:hypothetical protein